MNDSKSPRSPLPLVNPPEEDPADAVGRGIRSEPTELKNEEIAEIPGRLSCLASTTGVGRLDPRGRTARAVTDAALSTFIAF
jgi:hypothetical protein